MISNFLRGVDLEFSSDPNYRGCVLENLRILNSQDLGARLINACRVTGNLISGSAGFAILGSRNGQIGCENIVRDNGAFAINMITRPLLYRNVALQNDSAGIRSNTGNILDSVSHGNGGAGFQVPHSNVVGNVSTENSFGIEYRGLGNDNLFLSENTFRSNPSGNQSGTCLNCVIPADHNRF